jgi:hypothetical protein
VQEAESVTNGAAAHPEQRGEINLSGRRSPLTTRPESIASSSWSCTCSCARWIGRRTIPSLIDPLIVSGNSLYVLHTIGMILLAGLDRMYDRACRRAS